MRYSVTIVTLLVVLSLSNLSAIDPRFHTYGEVIDELRITALRYPNITRLYTIGYTTGFQLPVLAMKISDNPQIREDEPRLLYNGMHHACELIGPEICLYLINDLVTKYGFDSFITSAINSSEIWVVPMVNPDGNYIVESGIDTLWRKNCRDNNGNGIWDSGDGVDLNRNYDFLWNSGGSTDPSNREYRGPYAFSESETRTIRDLTSRERFIFDICYHSSREQNEGEAVYYPWRWGNPFSPDNNHIKPIAESIAYRIRNDAGNGTYYAIFGRATEGGLTRNWLYYAVGTFSYTIEVSHTYFPPSYRVDSICQRNLAGAYYLLQRAFGSQITGHVTDTTNGNPLVAEVKILQAYAPRETIAPRMSDSLYGRYYRILSPGSYTVQVIKPGYEDKIISNVSVLPNQLTYLDIQLKPDTTVEELTSGIVRIENFKVSPTIIRSTNRLIFNIAKESKVTIKIYSENGKLVKTIISQDVLPGNYSLVWNNKDNKGKKVGQGIYFAKITVAGFEQTKKIIVLE